MSLCFNTKREVGLAVIGLKTARLTLYQFADRSQYSKTLAKALLFDPVEILVCDTGTRNKCGCMFCWVFGFT